MLGDVVLSGELIDNGGFTRVWECVAGREDK